MKNILPDLPAVHVGKKTGRESFFTAHQALPFNVLDFWRWSSSDLLSNATRGVLAEFIVAKALGLDLEQAVREEWAPYDLFYNGLKIEVKSAAYLQSWHQARLSTIVFNIAPTLCWNPETNEYETEKKRQADLYVFCLLTSTEKEAGKVDPLNLDEWAFYLLPTPQVNALFQGQKTLRLSSLKRAGIEPVAYCQIKDRVAELYDLHQKAGGSDQG